LPVNVVFAIESVKFLFLMVRQRFFSTNVPLYLAFAAIVIGTRFLIVAVYGNAIPYLDQWDAELDQLFRPWVEGTLHWQDLLAPHNEHRVFTGRVLALLLFLLNGRVLDSMLEMAANAVLLTGTLTILLHGILNMFPESGTRLAITIFATLFLSMPLGVENILTNNSSLYFLLLFSYLAMLALSRRGQDSWGWDLLVVASTALSCLSFASGALTAVVGVAFLGIQWVTGVQRSRSTVVLICLLAMMVTAAVLLTPTISGHAQLRSKSILGFIISLLRMTGGLVIYTPSAVFMVRQLQRKPGSSDPSWFLFALCLWVYGQMLVIAYGRGDSNVLTSRYLDLYTGGIMANLAAILLNMRDKGLKWTSLPLNAWLLAICIGIGVFLPQIAGELKKKSVDRVACETMLKTYFSSHDPRALDNPNIRILYPDPGRLKSLLDEKTIRSFMPTSLRSPDHGASGSTGDSLKASMFFAGSLLSGTGVGFILLSLFKICNCRNGSSVLTSKEHSCGRFSE
jgi:type IV secretory pathway VirB2 component (pilin)